jgi:hypothetical protein
MTPIITRGLVKVLLPIACSWAEEQERIIHREGVVLTTSQIADARRIGIREPLRVRLRVIDDIPLPLHPLLKMAAEKTGLISPHTIGLTLRYGIYIRSDCWGDRQLVVHELAHTAQYERLGGFQPFLEQYLDECITPPGYPFGPLEQEAKRVEREICSS